MGGLKGGSESSTSVPGFVTEAGEFGVDRAMQLAELGYMPYFGPDVAALSPMGLAGFQSHANALNAFNMASPVGGQGGGQSAGGQGGGLPLGEMATGNYQPAQVGDSEKAQFINEQYQRGLGRAPDQAGYDYYMGQDINMDDPQAFQQGFQQGVQVDPLTGLPAASQSGGMAGYSGAPIFTGAQDQLRQRMPGLMDNYESMFIDPITAAPPAGSSQGAASGGLLGQDPAEMARQKSMEMYGTPDLAHLFTSGYDRN